MIRSPRLLAVGLAVAACLGCRPDDQRTDTADPTVGQQLRSSWSPEVVAHVDAGNAAIRADSFDLAKEHFEAVIELEPELAVGWFGLYMSEQGRGDAEAAAAALERAQEIQAGASLIHPQNEGGGG
jgi:uncharacterized membrane-anchored protein